MRESYTKIMASKPNGARFEYARVPGDRPGFVRQFVKCAQAEGFKEVTTVTSEEITRREEEDAEDRVFAARLKRTLLESEGCDSDDPFCDCLFCIPGM